MNQVRLLYVGSNIIDTLSYINAFKKAGYHLAVLINHSTDYFPAEINGLKLKHLYEEKKKYSLKKLKITESIKIILTLMRLYKDKSKITVIRKVIKENKINVVFCNWGISVLPIITLIRSEFPEIPIIHELNTYPSFINPLGVTIQNSFYGLMIKKINARIHGSKQMYDYINKNFKLQNNYMDLIKPLYLPQDFLFNERLPLLSLKDNQPHIIFIGRADFSNKRPFDDIRKQIRQIIDLKIHIWISSKNKNIKESNYIHFYPWFNDAQVMNGAMATYMTQFDACIYMHNLDKKYPMYENSLQTRFRYALTAGIPIVMPSGLYGACQNFIEHYGIGFVYKNFNELKKKLCDRKLMENLRKNASNSAHKFTFENNFEPLNTLISKLKGGERYEQ